MTSTIRPLRPDEHAQATSVFRAALLVEPPTAAAHDRAHAIFLGGHTLGAFEGDRLVGTVGDGDYIMTVPGGELAMAGVTRVGVLPTHTRRGLLRELMQAQLDEIAARGVAVATLRATEAVIYGRFGYAPANQVVDLEVQRSRARLAGPTAPGRIELVEREDAVLRQPALHDLVGRWRSGALNRPGWSNERWRYDILEGDSSTRPYWIAFHLDDEGKADGFVNYGASASEPGGFPNEVIHVHDLFGADPRVEAALWPHVLPLDLARVVKAELRPLDDSVR